MTALVFSCEKANHAAPTPETTFQLSSSRYYYLDGSYYDVRYSYDSTGKLSREEQLDGHGEPLYVTAHYFEAGQLTRTQMGISPKLAEFRHSYEDNLLVKTEYMEFESSPQKQHFERIYEYQGPFIVKITQRDMVNDQASSYSVFTYDEGNISGIRNYNLHTGALEEEVAFEYDHQKNPLYGVTLNTGNIRYSAQHNVTRIKTTVENGQPVNKELVYEFEYNAQGYPLKSYQILPNGAKLPEASFVYSTR
jgi:hypothetical protein